MFHTKASGLGGHAQLKKNRMEQWLQNSGGELLLVQNCILKLKQLWGKNKDIFQTCKVSRNLLLLYPSA